MTAIAIVYHSGYGHTQRQAEAVAEGVNAVPGAKALLVPVAEAEANEAALNAADAIIFGTPTYMGAVSAPFKTFMDWSSKAWFGQAWKDKLAAGFTNSASQSGDKFNTLVQLATYAAQHGMLWVSLGLLPGNNSSKGSPDDLNRLGGSLGALAQSNTDEGPDKGPSKSDLATARHLGQRVAEQAKLRAPLKQAA
jgi:NAD(P)H dehydrogenase (quinone)